MVCTCVRCGKQFQSRYRTIICDNCKVATCIVCGKSFKLSHPYTQKTCSSECRGKYVIMSGIAKETAKKAAATAKKNDSYQKKLHHKVCAYCGKPFDTYSNRQIYCNDDHYGPCPVCGKPVKITDMSIGPRTCSNECKQKLTSNTNLNKYGVDCVFQNEDIKDKIKSSMKAKYGVEHYASTEEYKERFQSTCLAKYGVTSPLKNEAIKQKFLQTNQARYGGNCSTCSREVMQKMLSTSLKNNGGVGMASPTIRKRIEATNLEKYGYKTPSKSEVVKAKAMETCLERYGSDSWASSEFGLSKKILDSKNVDKFIELRADPASFISSNFDHKPTVKEICSLVGCTDTTVYNILISSGNRDLATFRSSTMEVEICQLLHDLNINFIRNCRSVITPYEIDFYLPDLRVGIECNPTATHNSSFEDPWGQTKKMPSYHKMKTDMCEKVDVFLFHIFGYEWETKKEIILSMLKNTLGKTENRIFARNTYVCELSNEECSDFLNKNHRQGSLSASIRLGLKETSSDSLLSVMTFNRIRNTIGYKNDNNYMELSRFCSCLNTTVVGGASKLFKYFTSRYPECNIVSFSDRSHTRGSLYSTLGFHSVNVSAPGYVWVNISDDSYFNRVSCQKKHLQKLFNDTSIDIENKTEKQIMEEHGYAQVFDSGTIRWEYCPSKLS